VVYRGNPRKADFRRVEPAQLYRADSTDMLLRAYFQPHSVPNYLSYESEDFDRVCHFAVARVGGLGELVSHAVPVCYRTLCRSAVVAPSLASVCGCGRFWLGGEGVRC